MTPGTRVKSGRALGRALVRRCPNCGRRGIFRGYYRLRERCPNCGYHFTAKEGFFLGVWVVNFAVSEGLMFVVLMSYILALGATGGDVPVLPVLAVALTFAIGAPLVFYPFAASTWAAIELIMDPARAQPG